MRTARSRTSGEYLGVVFLLFMAPSSQGKEPPQNPGRFKSTGRSLLWASQKCAFTSRPYGATRTAAGCAASRRKSHWIQILLATRNAFNPAELLLAALPACIIDRGATA